MTELDELFADRPFASKKVAEVLLQRFNLSLPPEAEGVPWEMTARLLRPELNETMNFSSNYLPKLLLFLDALAQELETRSASQRQVIVRLLNQEYSIDVLEARSSQEFTNIVKLYDYFTDNGLRPFTPIFNTAAASQDGLEQVGEHDVWALLQGEYGEKILKYFFLSTIAERKLVLSLSDTVEEVAPKYPLFTLENWVAAVNPLFVLLDK